MTEINAKISGKNAWNIIPFLDVRAHLLVNEKSTEFLVEGPLLGIYISETRVLYPKEYRK